MNILVFDVGTSSMRGVVFDGNAEILASDRICYHPVTKTEGIVEQPPADWVGALTGIAKKMSAHTAIDAVAITSQRSSVIPVGADGAPLRDAIMWQDTRTREICRRLCRKAEYFLAKTGSYPNTVYSGPKMSWIRQHEPEIYAGAKKMLVIPEYLIYVMTGEYHTDATYAGRSLLMDLKRREWDPDLLACLGIDEEKLCRISEPGSVVGSISRAFSERTGIPAGIPVVSSGGDQQCASIGQGVFRSGDLSVNVGTGAFLSQIIDAGDRKIPEGLTCNPSAAAGQYVLEARVEDAGSVLNWFMKHMWRIGKERDPDRILEGYPDGPAGTWCFPQLHGAGSRNGNVIFGGMNEHTDAEEMLSALLEGIGYEILDRFEKMESVLPVRNIFLSGGMSFSDRFSQLLADMLGRNLTRYMDAESTCAGAWMNAAAALHLYPTLEEAWRQVAQKNPSVVFYARSELYEAFQREKTVRNRLRKTLACAL